MNIFIAGHNGMVGSAILRRLELEDKYNVITCSRKELNLLNQSEVYTSWVITKSSKSISWLQSRRNPCE